MGAVNYLLDSNILIYLSNGTLMPDSYEVINKALFNPRISVISKIETLGFKNISKSETLLR